VASLSQGRTAAAQCGLFTYKSVPVIFEPPCNLKFIFTGRGPYSAFDELTRRVLLRRIYKRLHSKPNYSIEAWICESKFIKQVSHLNDF